MLYYLSEFWPMVRRESPWVDESETEVATDTRSSVDPHSHFVPTQACCYATVLWKPVISLVSAKLSEHLYHTESLGPSSMLCLDASTFKLCTGGKKSDYPTEV